MINKHANMPSSVYNQVALHLKTSKRDYKTATGNEWY